MLSVPAVASWVENREKVVALYALGEQKKTGFGKLCVVLFRFVCSADWRLEQVFVLNWVS